MTHETLVAEALSLPVNDRLALVERLMDSVLPPEDELSEDDWREAWGDEAERRLDLLGSMAPVPANEVFASVLRRLRG